ncbi:class I SAM-dependent methyltransferase [Novosphingobium sp.]|jgi:SAM-dependent methyltransferase|uniref:class I SAM-dependent methyltransferase n=1 Tax=Novosphingobium sp. TaxID=1874826 RepID=UPI002FE19A33
MSKESEIGYLAATGEAGRQHSMLKPFSDPFCGINLTSIGTIMTLLPAPPARLLDLGCGGAWTSVFYALHGYKVTGQDIAPDMIELAVENRDRHGLTSEHLDFLCNDYEAIEGTADYDCAVFFDSLHHADDEGAAIRSAYAALKPGGILLTHEPGEGHSTNPHSIAAMEQYGVNERDMPPSLIIERGMQAGFSSFRVLPMPAELLHVFFERHYNKWYSIEAFNAMKRLFRMLYKPKLSASSIVVLTK